MKLKRATAYLGLGLIVAMVQERPVLAGQYSTLAAGSTFALSDLGSVWGKVFNGTGALFKMRIDHVGFVTGCNTNGDTTGPIFTNCGAGQQGLTHLLIQGFDDRTQEIGDSGKVTIAISSGSGTSAGYETPGKGLAGCEKIAFLAQSNPARYRMLIGGNPRALTTFPTAGFYRLVNWSDSGNSSTVYCALATIP